MWTRRAFLRASTTLGTVTAAARARDIAAIAQATATVAGRTPEAVAADGGYWREIQRAFTGDRALTNLNNGNSSPTAQSVHDAMKRYMDDSNLLPVHYRGLLEQRFDAVRRQLAEEFGCEPQELAITRNASEALHIAQGGIDLRRGDEVVTTDQDYPRMLWMWDQRARRDGIVVKRIQFPVPAAADDLVRRFEQAITPRTKVLQFCHITNVTGQLFPVRDLCRLARARGIVSIVDGAQAAGHFPFTLRDLDCDIYGTSLHKWLMAPQGTGFLYVRRDAIERVWPMQGALYGMRGDIRKFEEIGTQPAAARAAISDALAFHQAIGIDRKAARLRYLTLRWANALRSHPRVRMLSSLEPGQTWGLATVAIDGVNAATLVPTLFDKYRIVISAAVTQGLPGPVFDFNGLRVTPAIYTTLDEIDRFVSAMQEVLRS